MDRCEEDVIVGVGCTFFQEKKRGNNKKRPAPRILPWGKEEMTRRLYII
jgi:hypothetical protein